jgi:hypothetical protein
MALPVPALAGITDTNALASRACNAARSSVAENLFTGLAVTGRSNTYISAHVPEELVRHLADVAEGHPGLDLREAERVLWGDVMPLVPVVDLAVGDYLHPRIQAVRLKPTQVCPCACGAIPMTWVPRRSRSSWRPPSSSARMLLPTAAVR